MELTISIIGFGNVGKIIGGLLLPYKEYSLKINIIDTDWNVSGAILDLKHGAELYKNHQIFHNDEGLLNSSDFIFHCAGASVPRGKSRLVTCQASIDITESIFKHYKPLKEPYIIVVANPVEIISFITQKITGLPKEKIIGTGTLLDSIRMNYVVKETNNNLDHVNAILLGEHGTTAFLSQQLSTVNNAPFNSLFDDDTIEELMILVKASAEEIKETQKATIYGVGYCAIQIFEALLFDKKIEIPVSTAIPKHLTELIGEKDIYLSLLSEVNSKGAFAIERYKPNQKEINSLKKSIELIKSPIPQNYL